MAEQNKLAVIRLRGVSHRSRKISSTLELLGLNHRNHCVVVPNNPSYTGMIKKVKDFVTWGEIDEATFKELTAKRKEGTTFRLNSPKKGLGKKGLKASFNEGGALGYRGSKINELIMRMI